MAKIPVENEKESDVSLMKNNKNLTMKAHLPFENFNSKKSYMLKS